LAFGLPAIIAGLLMAPFGLLATVAGYSAVIVLAAGLGRRSRIPNPDRHVGGSIPGPSISRSISFRRVLRERTNRVRHDVTCGAWRVDGGILARTSRDPARVDGWRCNQLSSPRATQCPSTTGRSSSIARMRVAMLADALEALDPTHLIRRCR
jgi:hypothetical protein